MVTRVWRAFWFAFWSALKQEATRRVPDRTLTIEVKVEAKKANDCLDQLTQKARQVMREFR